MQVIEHSPRVHPMRPAPVPARRASSGLDDMFALAGRLLRFSPLIALAGVVGGTAGYEVAHLLPKRYTSYTSILIDPKKPDAYGAPAAFANIYVDNTKISSVELVMTSSSLLEKVVRSEHLADLPDYGDDRPSLIERLAAPLLGPRPSAPDTPELREARALYVLSHAVRTQRQGATYVINVEVSAKTAELASRLTAAVANAYLDDQLDIKRSAAERDATWLAQRVSQLRDELTKSEHEVEAVREKYGLEETDHGPGATVERQTITDLNTQLAQAEGEVSARRARYEQALRLMKGGGDIQALPEVAASHLIQGLRQQQSDLNRVVADLSARYTQAYPALVSAQRDKRTLEAQIGAEVGRIVDGLRSDADAAVQHRDAVRAQLSQFMNVSTTASSGSGRVKLRDAQRVVDANKTVYDASLTRLKELEEQETRQEGEARIISEARAPDRPSFPRPVIFVAGGLVFGLFGGMGTVFLLPLLDRRVVNAATVEQSAELPVLARIPRVRSRDLMIEGARRSIAEYIAIRPLSRYAEAFRILRVALGMVGQREPVVVQVTSAVPEEGKSTTASSLAISAATAGIRTVLVDLDFYKPVIADLFGLEQRDGVVDVLLGNMQAGTALQTYGQLPLRVIGAGSSLRPKPEMVESPAFMVLLAELKKNFDLIVLDSPPVLAASMSSIVARASDTTVLVTAWRSTRQEQTNQAVAVLRNAAAPIAGIVINKCESTGLAGYRHYDDRYYGYAAA